MFSVENNKKLEDLLEKLEIIYAPLMDSEEYHTEPFNVVLDNVFSYIETFEEGDDNEFELINSKALIIMSQFSLLFHDVSFHSESIIVFDNFPNIVELSQFIFKFTKLSYTRLVELIEYKKVVSVLQCIDNEHIEFKFSIPYRLFKLLFLMAIYKAYLYVSILSKFILNQIASAMGIEDRGD